MICNAIVLRSLGGSSTSMTRFISLSDIGGIYSMPDQSCLYTKLITKYRVAKQHLTMLCICKSADTFRKMMARTIFQTFALTSNNKIVTAIYAASFVVHSAITCGRQYNYAKTRRKNTPPNACGPSIPRRIRSCSLTLHLGVYLLTALIDYGGMVSVVFRYRRFGS